MLTTIRPSHPLRDIITNAYRMDETTCNFASRYENIIYISCNPETLARDLTILCKTHVVKEMALFDQFPYTHHAEMGVKLTKKRNHL